MRYVRVPFVYLLHSHLVESHSFWTMPSSWIVPVSHSYRLVSRISRLRQAAGAAADDGFGIILITALHSFSKLFSLESIVGQ